MLPLIIATGLGLLLLYLGLFKTKNLVPVVSVAGLLGVAAAASFHLAGEKIFYYNHMMVADNFSAAFTIVLVVSAALIFLLADRYFRESINHLAEYYAILTFACAGAIIMVSFENLTMLFLGLEIMSLSVYVMAGIRKKDPLSNEASLKYFLLGAFFTAILLLGIAFIYGSTGSFDLGLIGEAIEKGTANRTYLYTGVLLMLIALAFKISLAPFHFWTPDVYDGSPTVVTAFMSTVVKIAGVAAVLRLFLTAFTSMDVFWAPVIGFLLILSLFVGNIAAIHQTSFKRLLAYSSIAHSGYMMYAIVANSHESYPAILMYAIGYSVATVGAFGVYMLVRERTNDDSLSVFNGLGRSAPVLAIVMTICMLSLAGIPLTAGFIGKFYVFAAASAKQQTLLVVIGALNAAIGIYYYFKVLIAMYFMNPETDIHIAVPKTIYTVVLCLTAFITILLGAWPALVAHLLK